ncbi:hypothetical protein NC652_014068 [Populus alba x Populus x berolinensis]|nr:hypothetical protein NC652_014068 [Populus alba x Populus x berolinensis]
MFKLLIFYTYTYNNYLEFNTTSPRYTSMPKYPKGVSVRETNVEGSEAKAVFSVMGMTCSACAGSVEKAVKRLPGIREAVVDVLINKAKFCSTPVSLT